MERVDVAVVGGGPAGSCAARAAATAGADAVLFERGVPRADRDAPGPDSTDAAGILDYWVDLMDLEEPFPEELIYRHLEGAEFIGPNERVHIPETGIGSSYPHFGFTYDRAGFDDWLLERAAEAGATYRVAGVREVDPDPEGRHTVVLRDGQEVAADAVVLADGPQRTVTRGVLERFLPPGRADALDSTRTNHIAYQEYRRFPEDAFEPDRIKFWWGHMPGHTAYPWVFPNDDSVARVGLTMPIGLDIDAVEDRDAYRLLRPEDDRIPSGGEYVERLLDLAYPDHDPADFPRVEDRGKSGGTETYPISSTRPIDSPVGADVAVAGGAMGATSAFHEGGAHVAMRTGKIAGRLAAEGELERYNDAWKRAIGEEVRRNVAMADLVGGYGPADWDRAFRVARRLIEAGAGGGTGVLEGAYLAGLQGLRIAAGYRWNKFRYRGGRYVQISEDAYAY